MAKFRTNPKRGQIKIKIFKIIAKSLQNLAVGVAGEKKKPARSRDGCRRSTATVIEIPAVTVPVELKSASKHETKRNQPKRGQIKIKIFKMVGKLIKDSAVWVAGGKKKGAGNEYCSLATVETTGAGLKPHPEEELKQVGSRNGQIKINMCKKIGVKKSGGKKNGGGTGLRWTTDVVPIISGGFETDKLFVISDKLSFTAF